MSDRKFLDTNILIYAHDGRVAEKQARARELIGNLLRERRGVVSQQVLQEFFATATRKLHMPSEMARAHVLSYTRFEVVSLSNVDIVAAIDLHRLHRFSIWDALIVRSALNSGCETLYSEDMQDGREIESLTIRNPFAPQNSRQTRHRRNA